ncbi:MAG: hypothetical protein MZW92_78590 [Comamonadaceae bacterium]|nr:hypothetical protein [Comamonadaceae bacterium]
MSSGTRDALEDLPLRYFSTRDAVILLGSQQRIAAPTLTLGIRAAWRSASWGGWMQALAGFHETSPILRIALHPTDQRNPALERQWRRVAAADRQPADNHGRPARYAPDAACRPFRQPGQRVAQPKTCLTVRAIAAATRGFRAA